MAIVQESLPDAGPATEPYTPFAHMPWVRWLDRTEIPAFVIALFALLLFIPFYDFRGMAPRLPLGGGAFPPAFALALMFLLQLTRGASSDLKTLVGAGKLTGQHLVDIAAGPAAARVEAVVGVLIGVERVFSQLSFWEGQSDAGTLVSPAVIAVCCSIVFYTVIQVHLVMFCLRQAMVFRRAARGFQVDLLAPEYNNVLSNPLIRFIALGLVALSFVMVLYQFLPYSTLQRRVLQGALLAGLVWLGLLAISMVPLLIVKSRIAVAKKIEISLVRLLLAGERADFATSQFGERIRDFSPADLMFYEDRIRNIWEWPFEAHIRRLVLFGLLPPLTWVMAALIEVAFELMLTS